MHLLIKYMVFIPLLFNFIQADILDINGRYELKAGFMVSIRSKFNYHRCGGALISSRSVVTNADCIFNESLSDLLVIIGSNTLNQGIEFMPDVYATCPKESKNENKPTKSRHIHDFDDLNSIETNEIGDASNVQVYKEKYLNKLKDNIQMKHRDLKNSKISPSQIFSIKSFYIHKKYDGNFLNNVAILELDRQVTFLHGVKIIGINTNMSILRPGDNFTLYGWDTQLVRQKPAHEISKVVLNLMNPNNCSMVFGSNFQKNSELCLKGISHIPRNGFGGSPVVKNGLLVGILSYGTLKTIPFSPTVAVNLSHYATFIEEVHDDIEQKNGKLMPRFVMAFQRFWQKLLQAFGLLFQ